MVAVFRCAQQDDRRHADRQGGRLAARRNLRQHRRGGGQRVGAVQSGHRAAPRASRRPPWRALFSAHFAAATNGCRPPCGRHGGLGRGRPAARARPVGCAGRPWVGGRWRGPCGARTAVGAAAPRAAHGGARAPAVTGPLPSINSILWSGFARSVFRCRPILEARVVGNGRNGRNGRCNGALIKFYQVLSSSIKQIRPPGGVLDKVQDLLGWSRRCAQSIQRRWFALGQLKSIYPGLLWHLL